MAAPHDSSSPTDTELARRTRAGDHDAFRVLYDRHGSTLFALLLRQLGSRHDAEEVLADVFLEFWQRCDRFDPDRGHVAGYLTLLTRSRGIDRLRSRRARPTSNDSTKSAHTADTNTPDPPESAADAEERRHVRQAIEALPEDQKQVVELAFFDGLTHNEVARTLDQPLGTVKSRIRRALIRLKELLRIDIEEQRSGPSDVQPPASASPPDSSREQGAHTP